MVKLINQKRKNSPFPKKKSLVRLTPGLKCLPKIFFFQSLEKRGLFQLGEFAGVDAQWNPETGEHETADQIPESGRLGDFFQLFSDKIFPDECVQRVTCEIGSNFPQLRSTFEW